MIHPAQPSYLRSIQCCELNNYMSVLQLFFNFSFELDIDHQVFWLYTVPFDRKCHVIIYLNLTGPFFRISELKCPCKDRYSRIGLTHSPLLVDGVLEDITKIPFTTSLCGNFSISGTIRYPRFVPESYPKLRLFYFLGAHSPVFWWNRLSVVYRNLTWPLSCSLRDSLQLWREQRPGTVWKGTRNCFNSYTLTSEGDYLEGQANLPTLVKTLIEDSSACSA